MTRDHLRDADRAVRQQNVVQLGRNDGAPGTPLPYRTTPRLGESALFPGMVSVQPEEEGVFQSRTGRTDRGIIGA